jgi:ABC-type polysaccharide/polyol phosphate transport system ATPase subunit
MVARLGFSVATDVIPDILLVDEILQVGDAEFQQRSAERITAIRHQGATMIFVSHSLPSVAAFCERAIWLDHGRVRAEGRPGDVIRQYQAGLGANNGAAPLS